MNKLTSEQRRRNMQAVRGTGSTIETVLAKALFAQGFRYRKNNKTVYGKPDITFKKFKLAIFVDGEFGKFVSLTTKAIKSFGRLKLSETSKETKKLMKS